MQPKIAFANNCCADMMRMFAKYLIISILLCVVFAFLIEELTMLLLE